MLKTLGRFHRLVVPLITWVILLIPFLIYQRYYVQSQQAYLTERGFRILGTMGDQLAAYIGSIRNTVTASSKDAQPKLYLMNFLPKGVVADPSDLSQTGPPHPEADRKGTFAFDFPPQLTAFWMRFDYYEPASPGGETAAIPPCPAGNSKHAFTVCGRLNLDAVVRQRFSQIGEDSFDEVLIADSKGNVLFQQTGDVKVTELEHVARAAEQSAHAQAAAFDTQPSDSNAPDGGKKAQRPGRNRGSFAAVTETSNLLDVELAGASYKLFLQPTRVRMGGGAEEDGGELVLCGLWSADRLHSSSFAVPYSSVIWIALLGVALGSFAWPFLKINYMSETERLRQSHGWLLALSMFLGTASVTLMLLNASYAAHAEQEVQADLHTIAREIQARVDTELGLALHQLRALSDDPEVRRQATAKKWNPHSEFLSKFQGKPDQPLAYPYFEMGFWADREGKQLAKFTVEHMATPLTAVGNYQFFQDAISQVGPHKPLVPVLARLNDDTPPYSLQPNLSPNTGEFNVVLSVPVSHGAWAFGDGAHPEASPIEASPIKVAALVTRPLSLVDSVLPPGFGFAVLDRDGKVWFHSSPIHNLSENFLQECKNPSSLRAALFSSTDHDLDLVYGGKAHEAWVTKLAHLGREPLALIVFYDSGIPGTVNMAIVLICSVLLSLYTVLILAVMGLDFLRKSPYPPEFIWPRPERSVRYAGVFAVNGLLILFFFLFYSRWWEFSLLAATAAVIVAAVLSSLLILRSKPPAWALRWEPALAHHFQITYVLAAVSLLTAVAVVPCFGFFKFSYDAASELAAKQGQLQLSKKLFERRDRIDRFYRQIHAPTEFAHKRFDETLDRYNLVRLQFLSYDPHKSKSEVDSPDWLQHWFDEKLASAARLFPTNELGAQMRMLRFASESSVGIKWSELGPNAFRVEWPGNDGVGTDAEFALWQGLSPACGGFLALMWLLLGGWFFLLTKKIFLPVSELLPRLEWVSLQRPEDLATSLLVLGSPRSGKSACLDKLQQNPQANAHRAIERFDLRVDLDREERRAVPHGSVAVLDHFEFEMDSPRYNRARLQFLERLLYSDGCKVILMSSVDPLYYLSEGAPGILAADATTATELLDRWARALSGFKKMKFETPAADFREKLNGYKGNPRTKRLAEWVERECGHTPYLREMGLGLLAGYSGGRFDREAMLTKLLDPADAYYSLLWSTLTARERLALYQLAKDGWANPNNDRALQELQRKGLICRAPMFRIMNESFRRFTLSNQDKGEIAEWERQGAQSTWRIFRAGIIATAVGLTAWLFYAQKELFNVSIGYIVTLGGAITAIANILGNLKGRVSSAAKASGPTESG